MRTVGICWLVLAIFASDLVAVPLPSDSKPIPEPTAEQLAAAKEAYAKIGTEYKAVSDPLTMQTIHRFKMPLDSLIMIK
jgi:hypothetical protein